MYDCSVSFKTIMRNTLLLLCFRNIWITTFWKPRCKIEDMALIILVLLAGTFVSAFRDPMYTWPLGNLSLYADIIGEQDIIHNANQKCFTFVDGPSSLPYSVLDKDEEDNHCFDANLKGAAPLHDLTISMFVYPDNDGSDISGTVLHYKSDDREIMRVRTLANTFLVSFRDEYGMSAGMMYLENFLTPKTWNLVTVARDYRTGRIIVYKNGSEVYNEDDEFSDVISFPHTGKLRIGKSLDEDDEDQFDGNFACVQIFDKVIQQEQHQQIVEYCHPSKWQKNPDYYFEESGGQWCLADRPPSLVGALVTMTTLSRESLWRTFLEQHDLQDSGSDSGYLKLQSSDKRPSFNDDLIGRFNATDRKVCARLCMRVDGCMAMLVEGQDTEVMECSLYDDIPEVFVDNPKSKFYILVD